jgi:multiple sugar transport system substrate-binding protein
MDENTVFQGVSPVGTPPPQPPSVPQQQGIPPIQNAPPQPMGSQVPPSQPTMPQTQSVQPVAPIQQQQNVSSTPSQSWTPQPIVSPQPISTPQPMNTPPSGTPVVSSQTASVQSVLPAQPVSSGQIVSPPPPIVPPASGGKKSLKGSLPLGGIIKAVVGLFLLIVIGFVLVGVVMPMFSGNKDEKVTLVYWGLWEDPNVMQKVIDDFQKENPNITVKYEKQDIKQQYRKKLLTRMQNGSGPDIFEFHNTWLPQMRDVLTPIPTDVITPTQFKKDYFPVIVNDITENGAIYGIPLQIDTLAMYTNTQMLEASSLEPPVNWEDFGRSARSLTVKDEEGKILTAGAALGTYDNITHAPDIISLLFLQNGADIYDLASTPTQSLDTLTYYSQDYAGISSNVWDTSLDPSLLAFAKGNLAMYFGYSWDIFAIKAMNPALQFKVSPVPHLPLGRKITIASYWVEGVSQKSKHQKQSMLFMKYLAKKETLQKLYTEASKTRMFGNLYPRVDLAESLKSNELIYPFIQQAGDATSSFFVSDTYDEGMNDEANIYLGTAIRSMLENTSAETALEQLSNGVAQKLKKNGYAKQEEVE